MQKKYYLLCFLLFFLTQVSSQSIWGVVANIETGEKIPYVNVGYRNQSIGTVSNENGEFQLKILSSEFSDSIVFSSIGYHKVSFLTGDLKNRLISNTTIFMRPQTDVLEEIIVSSRAFSRIQKLGNGRGSKRKKVGFGPNDNLGREIGTVIETQIKEALIDKAFINIGINKYGKIKLRVNIYKWENNKITERLNNVPLYFETELQEGVWEVDLKKYNIEVSGDFFISFEYIENMGEFGLYFTFSINKNPTFIRESINSEWEEIKYNNKRISISINCVLSY